MVTMARMSEQVGRVLGGRYRLLALIGAGGSAQVYLAEDVQLHRRVAVKVLRDVLAAEPGFLQRFEAEARAAAALNHPNIVAIYDVGQDGVPYLVTEHLAGGSLQAVLATGRRLSVSQALLVALDAARGLEYAHRQGLVHRDIKPANLLFGEEGRLRIADFELARALAEVALTEPDGTPLGTARYASPEQVRGDKVGPAGDVYSLALVLVEAVTGVAPFAADTTVASLMARLDRPLEVPESLGPLQKVLARAGSIDPTERPDAGELVVSLLAAAEELPRPDPIPLPGTGRVARAEHTDVAPSPVGDRGGGTEPRPVEVYDHASEEPPLEPRRGWAIAAILTILLALAGAGSWVWWQGRTPTHEVPQLVGRSEEELDELVGDLGWEVEVARTREDGTEPGEVVDQDPEAGTRLAEGEALLVTVSLGNPMAPFPTGLVGRSLPEAERALTEAGFELGDVTRTYDEDVERDVVIELGEEFRGLEELPTSTPVDLVVSDGPAPREVPDLTGRSFAEAAAALEELGLVPVREERSSRDARGGGGARDRSRRRVGGGEGRRGDPRGLLRTSVHRHARRHGDDPGRGDRGPGGRSTRGRRCRWTAQQAGGHDRSGSGSAGPGGDRGPPGHH